MPTLRLLFLSVFLATSAAAQNIETVALMKLAVNEQTSATPLALGFAAFAAVDLVQPALVTATLRTPTGTRTLTRQDPTSYIFVEPFFTRATLDAAYPQGNYTIQVDAASYAVNLGAGTPNTPAIADFAAAQSISNPASFVLRWNAFQGATDTDLISVTIESTDGQFVYDGPEGAGFLPGNTTELPITLPPNKSFTGLIIFLRSTQIPGNNRPYVYSGSASGTDFTLRTLAVAPPVTPPSILAQPADRSAPVGTSVTFGANATGGGTLTYQWRHNGTAIPGATSSTLTLPSVQAFQAGSYTLVVTNAGGTVTSTAATLSTTPISTAGSDARLANLSTRGQAGTGGNSLIPGFVIGGTGSKRLLIRALGPALVQFGLAAAEVVADPTISLLASGNATPLATNDDWGASDAPAIVAATSAAGAFALPAGSFDSALVVTLPPGAYTALVAGKTVAPGIAIVEVYDLDAPGSGPRLINIATRGLVGTDSRLLIPGFVVGGTAPKTYVIRGIGPSLAAFGQAGVLADPVLSVYQGNTLLFTNDDWSNNTTAGELVDASQRAGAFALASGSLDSALLVTLRPGAYTFQLAGKGSATGVALVEVYEVP
ncbi:MAG: immunoglobulin domain-containing protein [Verrucomicrobiota bacterium]